MAHDSDCNKFRFCHNHLKQPLKMGEPLHHQGTNATWARFSHVTVGSYGGPRLQRSIFAINPTYTRCTKDRESHEQVALTP